MATVQSMTGFGEGRAEDERLRVAVTIRSVNQRFLDMTIRLPDPYRAFEVELAALFKQSLLRGRVEARYAVTPVAAPPLAVSVRREVAEKYRQAARELGGEALSASELLRMPEVVSVAVEDEAGDTERRLFLEASRQALEGLVASRQAEGEHLERIVLERLDELAALRAELAEAAPEAKKAIHEGLERRIGELLADKGLDPARLAQEAALLADRADVQEELDRLEAHLDAFRKLLAGEGSRGKRMDFLTQEILRELNTLGSKCRNTAMLDRVVAGKVACEQLKEQVQNIE